MSDPYDDLSRRYGVQGSNGQSSDLITTLRAWLAAAMTALGLLVGGIIGHSWGWGAHERLAQSNPPATTGSAPSHN
jgi:hypothetical protein